MQMLLKITSLLLLIHLSAGFYNWHRKRNFIVNTFCPSPGGIFSYPGDCNSFVTCTYGRGCVMNCPKGLEFNPHHRVCTTPDKSHCQTDPRFASIEPPPPCHKGYVMSVEEATPEPVPSTEAPMAIHFPEDSFVQGSGLPVFPQVWPEQITEPPQAIQFPEEATGAEIDGGYYPEEQIGETVYPTESAAEEIAGETEVAPVDQLVPGEESGSEEDSGEVTFEDWQEWINFFNDNRHNAPAFMAVRDSFMDPRYSHAGKPKVPFKRSKSNPRSLYFYHRY